MDRNSTVRLEVDPSIIEKNLLIVDQEQPSSDELDPIFELLGKSQVKKSSDLPYNSVRPDPGFCIKTHTLDGDKLFINVCYTEVIPPPKDITDEELISILESDDVPSYVIPLSVGSAHIEEDKSGHTCTVHDIAVSTSFFQKIQTNSLFRTFFVVLALDVLKTKHNVNVPEESKSSYVILKNRKQMGQLQVHNIEKRPVRTEPPKKMIEVLSSVDEETKPPVVQTIHERLDPPIEQNLKNLLTVDDLNKLRLFAVPKIGEPTLLLALAKVKALSGSDIELDVGVRRLVVTCERNPTIHCVLPYPVQPDKVMAQYFVNLQVLKVCLLISKDAGDYQKIALNDTDNLRELKDENGCVGTNLNSKLSFNFSRN